MHREMTLIQRSGLCLAAFFMALAAQIFLSFYQSGTVLRELDRKGAKTVYARCPLSDGVSMAVYNRLIRAAAIRVVEV